MSDSTTMPCEFKSDDAWTRHIAQQSIETVRDAVREQWEKERQEKRENKPALDAG